MATESQFQETQTKKVQTKDSISSQHPFNNGGDTKPVLNIEELWNLTIMSPSLEFIGEWASSNQGITGETSGKGLWAFDLLSSRIKD